MHKNQIPCRNSPELSYQKNVNTVEKTNTYVYICVPCYFRTMCTVEAFFARGALMTTTAPMVNDDADLSLLFQRLSFVVSAHFLITSTM